MSEKVNNRGKFLSVKADLYDSLLVAARKADFLKEDGTANVSEFVNKTLPSFGLEKDDVKFIFRVPKDVASDHEQLRLFLFAQVEQVLNKITAV